MTDLRIITTAARYSDWANQELLRASTHLAAAELDRPFEIGLGSLRKTLQHIWAGESVWTSRMQGKTETPWPDAEVKAMPAELLSRFRTAWADRDRFLATVQPADLARPIVYRDSKGSLFSAPLADMLLQMLIHSAHHRAQAANMFRHLGASPADLDFMYWARVPA